MGPGRDVGIASALVRRYGATGIKVLFLCLNIVATPLPLLCFQPM